MALAALLTVLHFSFVGQPSELAVLIGRAANSADAAGGFHVIELRVRGAGTPASFRLPNGTLAWEHSVAVRRPAKADLWGAVLDAVDGGLGSAGAGDATSGQAGGGDGPTLGQAARAAAGAAPPEVRAVLGWAADEAFPLLPLARAAAALADASWLPALDGVLGQSLGLYQVSRHRGHLYLADDADAEGPGGVTGHLRARLSVPGDTPGLGSPLARLALRLSGARDVPVVWAVHRALGGGGFLRSLPRGRVLALSKDRDVADMRSGALRWMVFKLGTLCSALFVVFAAMGLTSFVFTETQRRMVRFTLALGHAVQRRRPVLRLVLAHSVESLVFVPIMVGLLFFMFEFFADKLLAFLVFISLWGCEVFAVVACRTVQTVRVFPVAALLTLTWLMIYVLTYPFGLHHLALACVCAAVTTTGFHQWTAFELPALEAGRLSEEVPRETVVVSPAQGLTADLVRSLERGGVLGAGLGLGGGRMPVRAVMAGLGRRGHDDDASAAAATGRRHEGPPARPRAVGAAPAREEGPADAEGARRRRQGRPEAQAEAPGPSSALDAMGTLLGAPAGGEAE